MMMILMMRYENRTEDETWPAPGSEVSKCDAGGFGLQSMQLWDSDSTLFLQLRHFSAKINI